MQCCSSRRVWAVACAATPSEAQLRGACRRWSERSFEASTSFLEGLVEQLAAERARARTIDSAFDDSGEQPAPARNPGALGPAGCARACLRDPLAGGWR
eukprot:COSAG01_NODE_6362_length_3712_cov_9.819541_3_plen_99_part_00